jgi:hypothetical protein
MHETIFFSEPVDHNIGGMEKTGGSIVVSHPFKEVEDGNMADYHLLSEETD